MRSRPHDCWKGVGSADSPPTLEKDSRSSAEECLWELSLPPDALLREDESVGPKKEPASKAAAVVDEMEVERRELYPMDHVIQTKICVTDPSYASVFDCVTHALANKHRRCYCFQARTLSRLKKGVSESFAFSL